MHREPAKPIFILPFTPAYLKWTLPFMNLHVPIISLRNVALTKIEIQYNLNGSNTDGSFSVDDSNSFFQSLQNSSNSSRKQIFRDFFLILS